MAGEWVDFKAVKKAVSMQMVLDRYGISGLSRSGDELRGRCPIHNGSPKSKTFSVNLRKNAFQCFSKECNARGNVLDFVSRVEACSVRDAGVKLKEWFKVGESPSDSHTSDGGPVSDVALGIYKDSEGALFEVTANAISGEYLEPLIVYRELFGEYRYWVAPPQNFGQEATLFVLVKLL